MDRKQLNTIISVKFGHSPAEWRITKERDFENWDGSFTNKKGVMNMILSAPGRYLIQPYYASNLPKVQISKPPGFGDTLTINNNG